MGNEANLRYDTSNPQTSTSRIFALGALAALSFATSVPVAALVAAPAVNAADQQLPVVGQSGVAFLIPFVVALKEGDPADNRPGILRSGWSTSLGLFNPTGRPQEYRFSYFDRSGGLTVSYRTRPVPAGQNLFTTPEVMACIDRSPNNPFEECRPEATYIFEQGDPSSLVERTFVGYVVVEDIDHSDPFLASAWMARGGADLINPECRNGSCEFISFGYNRAGFNIPAVPIDKIERDRTASLLFPGVSLIGSSRPEGEQLRPRRCGSPSVREGLCVPDLDEFRSRGVEDRPNGATAAVVVVNLGSSDVRCRLTFTPSGANTIGFAGEGFRLRTREQKVLLLSRHLRPNLGSGSVRLDVEEGESALAGIALQSDLYYQFLGYGIAGETIPSNGGEALGASHAAQEFVVPYAVHTGGGDGFDSQLSMFNPGLLGSVLISYIDRRGDEVARDALVLAAGANWTNTLSQMSAPSGFVGWLRIRSSTPILVSAQVARGGFDQRLYGWQSFAFRVPVIAERELTAAGRIIFLAVNESRGQDDEPPPIAPFEPEDIEHVNGFDIGVFVANLDEAAASFRLSFLRRFVSRNADDLLVSHKVYTLQPGEGLGISAAQEFRDVKERWLDDGMLIVEAIDPQTLEQRQSRFVATAVQSDRGFRYFSYGVPALRLP